MRITIDNKLYMDCPEGFRQLTEEELQKMNLIAGGKAHRQKHEAVFVCMA